MQESNPFLILLVFFFNMMRAVFIELLDWTEVSERVVHGALSFNIIVLLKRLVLVKQCLLFEGQLGPV